MDAPVHAQFINICYVVTMLRILVVEDDVNLQRLMAAVLKRNGYDVLTADDGAEALDRVEESSVDLVVCDVMMPGMNGYELTRELRSQNSGIPILMVTARETIEDKRRGFHLGADDYMVKPIDMDEMLMRVAALLRRAHINAERKLKIGAVELDYDALTVTYGDEIMTLPVKEFLLLFKLLSYPRQIFTRRQLMDEIWGMETETEERTVDVHVKRLREKLGGVREFEIQTVRGLGYRAERLA